MAPRYFKQTAIASAILGAWTYPGLVSAQSGPVTEGDSPNTGKLEEVVVTARKKGESELDVPIAIKLLSGEQLERYGIDSFQDIAAFTPGLMVGSAPGNSGGSIMLRGIGTFPASPGVDQAVALNLDGVTIADGLALRSAQFDLAQVEVLQGPQSLYYGKNTSGGLINVRSADPTDELFAKVSAAYTEESDGWTTEAILSGPLGDTFGGRLAYYHVDEEGYFENPLYGADVTPTADQIAVFGPELPFATNKEAPEDERTGYRLTLTWDPTDALSMRFKGSYLEQEGADGWSGMQTFHCPSGIPDPGNIANISGVGDCKLDDDAAPIGQNVNAEVGDDPLYRDGTPYQELEQNIYSLDLAYEVTEGITFNSVTGMYDLDYVAGEIVTASAYPGIGSTVTLDREEFSQEFRVGTDFSSPLNGEFGLYYQEAELYSTVSAFVAGAGVFNAFAPEYTVDSETYSAFGQLTYDLFDGKAQISAGARYTEEEKDVEILYEAAGGYVQDRIADDTIVLQEFLPEVTLSWFPGQDTNVFVTYKQGAKSGGFNMSAITDGNPAFFNGTDIRYDNETVDGFEGGIKTRLFDGQLQFNATAYMYTYEDIQVSAYDPVLAVASTLNAATLDTKGVQFFASYAPSQLLGFSLTASLDFTHARYDDYVGACYTGQTFSEGCNLDFVNGVYNSQDFSGEAPIFAPDTAGNLSASYDFGVGSSGLMMGLSATATYSDSYDVIFAQPPGSEQDAYTTIDAQVRLYNDDNGWEVALVGKNLTDERAVQWGLEQAGTASPRSDLIGISTPPRMLTVRVTLRPFDMFR